MVVTGSLIPTIETITPSPIEVVTSETIQQANPTDITDLLRRTSVAFLGSDNIGQEVNNDGKGEAGVAVRNLPTLVLLNGRRLAKSSFSLGSAVDLNTIPLSMIDRIEVLKDGASTAYGADAIGGVVNVILKKNFQGAEIGGQYGFTTDDDDYEQYSAYVTAGIATERTSITAGAQYYRNSPLLTRDRPLASLSIEQLAARGVTPLPYFSSTFQGRVDDYILANPYVNVPDEHLGKPFQELINLGIYIPIASTPEGALLDQVGRPDYPLLNTSPFTYSILEQERRQMAASFEHQLFDDRLVLYGDFLLANNRATAQLAPALGRSLDALGAGRSIIIPASNPYNPFGTTLVGGADEPWIRTRFNDLGPRTYDSETFFYRILTGLKGRIDEDVDWIEDLAWSAGFNYTLSDQTQDTRNVVSLPALNLALEPDLARDPTGRTSRLTDSEGNPLPTFDYFGRSGNPRNAQSTLDAIRATSVFEGESELLDFDAILSGNVFELPAGPIGFAMGAIYRWEDLSIDYDSLSQNNLLLGSNVGGELPGGGRRTWAGFVEVNVPIFSEDMAIPALNALEITAAGRFESLDPGGSTQVPKVGLRWKPLDDDLILRATYSQGFLAPALFTLYGAPENTAPTVTFPDGVSRQVPFTQLSDPDLTAASATIWTGGFVYSPEGIPGLTLSLDYYNIDNPDISLFYDFQGVVDSLNALGSASPFAPDFTFRGGGTLTNSAPNQVTSDNWGNARIRPTAGSTQRTDGFDLSAAYEFRFEKAGRLFVSASANILLNYEISSTPNAPFEEFGGQYTDRQFLTGGQGTLPDWNLATSAIWDYRDFTLGVFSRYIPEVDDTGSPIFTIDGRQLTVDDWFTVDLQLAYHLNRGKPATRWYDGFRVAVGCNNISDQDVPFVVANEDNTDKQTYGILGRLVYFQVSKTF
jgi:iron complex outermembrane receptor protein